MGLQQIKEKIKQNERLKLLVFNFFVHPVKTRPQWWIRLFQFIYLKRGKKSVIYRSVRKDLVPFKTFSLGAYSVIEDYSCINNAVGDVIIGSHSRVGLNNTIIGPVTIGNHVNLAQGIVMSGLNHNYEDPNSPISSQGVSTAPIIVNDDVWIGANVVITAGTTIGKHSVVAGGSVVTKSIPDYSVVGGNPARILKQYNFETHKWERVKA